MGTWSLWHRRQSALAILVLLAMLWCAASEAKVIEETLSVPVKVTDRYGKEHAHDLHVLVYYDDAQPKPYPVAVIGHGRAAYPEQRASQQLAVYAGNARWLARLGFFVAVPARIGYAPTGGQDIEDTGPCNNKYYPPAYLAGAQQTLQLLAALRQRTDIAPTKGLVLGQSMGGAIAITVASLSPRGIQLVINFAGGGGGNAESQPGNPCAPTRLQKMFGDYGKTARMPSLWVYTENDMWMGNQHPKEWFAAFKENGGQGEYLALPANGKDGHGVFIRDPKAWRAQVLEVIRAQGLVE